MPTPKENEKIKMTNQEEALEEWIGKEAFGLGCEISAILAKYSVDDREGCLRRLLTSIKNWHTSKHQILETHELIKAILNSDFNLISRKRELLLENLNKILASKQSRK